jgi:hypothetical protein
LRTTNYAVRLADAERDALRMLIGHEEAPARRLAHARIQRKADRGEVGAARTDAAIAGAVEVHPTSVVRERRPSVEAALHRKAPDCAYPRVPNSAVEAKRLADKLGIHHAPAHDSWPTIAEIDLSSMQRQCLDRRPGNQATVKREVAAWIVARKAATTVVWQVTATTARIKLKRLFSVSFA